MQPASEPIGPDSLILFQTPTKDRWLGFIVALSALLGLAYNFIIIPGYGPDELRHFGYVKLLLEQHQFPYLLPDGSEYYGAHTLHPPLYYVCLLPLFAVGRLVSTEFCWHFTRLGSLAFCVASLPLIYQIGLRAGAGSRNVARLVTAQVGLLPMIGMTSGTLNNDSSAFFASTIFLWLLTVKFADDRSIRAALWLGLCLGLGTLTKLSVLLCDGVAFAVYLVVQDGVAGLKSARLYLRAAIILTIGLLIPLPWFIHNYLLYGLINPVPPAMPIFQGPASVFIFHPQFPIAVLEACWSMFCTTWSQIDWIPETARPVVFGLLILYMLAATGGVILGVTRRRKPTAPPQNQAEPRGHQVRIATSCIYAAFIANWIVVVQIALFYHWGWAQGGRYLLPSLVGMSAYMARGWFSLAGSGLKRVLVGWVVGVALLNLLCVYWLICYLNPTFGPKG